MFGLYIGIAITQIEIFCFSSDARNRKGYTPLHFASMSGQAEVVIALLKSSADINAKGLSNVTPLHLAVSKNT